MDVDWGIVNFFHPEGVVVYRTAVIHVPLSGGRLRLHLKLEFNEFDNFNADTVNVRVIGGPLKLNSFRAPRKAQYNDEVILAGSDERIKGKVLSTQPLNTGLLLVRLQIRDGVERQLVGATEIVTNPRRKAVVHLEFERNPKLRGDVAKVPIQINYVLTGVQSSVSYQLNLANMKLEGFVVVRNESNKHLSGTAAYSTMPLTIATKRPVQMRYEATRSASAVSQSVGASLGLDSCTLQLGEQFIKDSDNILFLSAVLEEISIVFEVFVQLPTEMRDVRAQPILEIPNLAAGKLADGSMTLYDSDGRILTTGQLRTGAVQARVSLQPLDHSVTLSNTPVFKRINDDHVEVTNNLMMHHTGQETARLRIKFPQFMRWGSDGYNVTFKSNTSFFVKLEPGMNTESVKITYQKQVARRR